MSKQEKLELELENMVSEMAQLMAFGFWDEAEALMQRIQFVAGAKEEQ